MKRRPSIIICLVDVSSMLQKQSYDLSIPIGTGNMELQDKANEKGRIQHLPHTSHQGMITTVEQNIFIYHKKYLVFRISNLLILLVNYICIIKKSFGPIFVDRNLFFKFMGL